ncbi:hypothetical protein [Campylobacter sp.]
MAGYRGLFDAAKRSAYKRRAWNLDEICPSDQTAAKFSNLTFSDAGNQI